MHEAGPRARAVEVSQSLITAVSLMKPSHLSCDYPRVIFEQFPTENKMAPPTAASQDAKQDADRRFLLALIHDKDTISRAETDRLAVIMGGGTTWNACRSVKSFKSPTPTLSLLSCFAVSKSPFRPSRFSEIFALRHFQMAPSAPPTDDLDRKILMYMFQPPTSLSQDVHGEIAAKLGLPWNTFRSVQRNML